MHRLKALDFLRGIAIILVFFRHQQVEKHITQMSWFSVDLFFVLSGFLVSGLLFKEYKQHHSIKPLKFLIRRGFKIYPAYFLLYPPYVMYNQRFTRGMAGDLTFTQNYLTGWGYSYGASWSLAVEEHFYFGLCIVIWLVANKKNKDPLHISNPFYRLPQWIFTIMIFCLFLRILSNYLLPGQEVRNFTMTHLRMDTILIGVLVSYFYHFHANWFRIQFEKVKSWLFLLIIPGLIWTPFISPVPSYFVKTIGFTIVFLALGILLVYFVFNDKIVTRLNQAMSAPVVNAISKIGVCSYPIYIIHILVINIQADIIQSNHWVVNPLIRFVIALSVSIAFGFLSTYTMEKFYLQLRDKFYPSRTGLPV